jgi:hypothetical protein
MTTSLRLLLVTENHAEITTAQTAMVPIEVLIGRKADAWGRQPIFLAGLAVLPLRGVLYTLIQNPYALCPYRFSTESALASSARRSSLLSTT